MVEAFTIDGPTFEHKIEKKTKPVTRHEAPSAFIKQFWPEHVACKGEFVWLSAFSMNIRAICSCDTELEVSVRLADCYGWDVREVNWLMGIGDPPGGLNQTAPLHNFISYLTPQALAIYDKKRGSNVVVVGRKPDGTWREAPAVRSSLCKSEVDLASDEVLWCAKFRVLGRTLTVDATWAVPDRAVREFAELFNVLVAEKRVDYGVMTEAFSIRLGRTSRERRVALLLYPYSDYSREELNAWCKVPRFGSEWEVPPCW